MYTGAFIQDNWKVKPSFRLNIGVRYDSLGKLVKLQSPKLSLLTLGSGTTRNDQIANATIGPHPDGSANALDHTIWELSPRLGFSWDIGGKGRTALRGGVDLFANQPPYIHITDITAGNLPNIFTPSINVRQRQGTPAFRLCDAPKGFDEACPLVVPSNVTFNAQGGIVGQRANVGGYSPNYKLGQTENWTLSSQDGRYTLLYCVIGSPVLSRITNGLKAAPAAPGSAHVSGGLRMFISKPGYSRYPASMLQAVFVLCLVFSVACFARGQQQENITRSMETLGRAGKYDQALELARPALQGAPSNYHAWTLEGIVFTLKGSNEEALQAFDRALGLSPDYLAALKGEAQLLYRTHDPRAVLLLEKVLRANPADLTTREMLAIAEEKRGDCERAIASFTLSAEMIKNHPESLGDHGYCLMHAGQTDEALPVFKRLVAILPAQTYPKYDLAVVLVRLKQFRPALDILGPLVEIDHADPDVLSLASEAYEGPGDTPQAVPLLRQAISIELKNPDYYVSFAALCINHDSFQTGIDMLNAGIGRIPANSSLYIARGMLYAQLAQFDKAEEDFRAAEKLDSAQNLSAYAIDLAELQRNRTGALPSTLRRQVKAHPENALFHPLLAELLINQGAAPSSEAFEEASRSALEAVKLKPAMASAHDVLATIYMRSEQSSLAIAQVSHCPSLRSLRPGCDLPPHPCVETLGT